MDATDLFPLLDYLAATLPVTSQHWNGWSIAPVAGGANNLLFRVAGSAGTFAVKFTIRDARDRAGREYAALCAIEQAGFTFAPRALLLDRDRYPQPVVVQTWLDGTPLAATPHTDAAWSALIDHYCAIRIITPANTTVPLQSAVINALSAATGRALIQQQLALLPTSAQPESLRALLDRFATCPLPNWPAPPQTLCRVDSNCRNFLQRAGAWVSVDWENSGWGDPAFEIADLLTHPAYETVPAARWHWLVTRYAQQSGDSIAPIRIDAYQLIMLVWWVVRLARYLYDMPRGRDQRLVQHVHYQSDVVHARYQRYLAHAHEQITATQYDKT